jgi:hypothetical protein
VKIAGERSFLASLPCTLVKGGAVLLVVSLLIAASPANQATTAPAAATMAAAVGSVGPAALSRSAPVVAASPLDAEEIHRAAAPGSAGAGGG